MLIMLACSFSLSSDFLNLIREYICGFRGKLMGHDVDILLTHREEGKEQGLLTSLLKALDRRQMVLTGQWLKSTFTSDDFHRDSKSTLDQFEKWLGICKFEKAWSAENSGYACASVGSDEPRSEEPDDGAAGNRDKPPDDATSAPTACKRQKTDSSPAPAPALPPSCRSRVPTLPQDVSSDRTWKARRVDLIVAPYSQYFYALVGWTGNKHFNRDLRLYAQREMNMKLSSHGLWDSSKVGLPHFHLDMKAPVFHLPSHTCPFTTPLCVYFYLILYDVCRHVSRTEGLYSFEEIVSCTEFYKISRQKCAPHSSFKSFRPSVTRAVKQM